MEIRFVDNQDESLGDVLASRLGKSEDTRIAVAFVTRGGLRIIHNDLEKALLGGSSVEILVGLDLRVTDPKALWAMRDLAGGFENFNYYCLQGGRDGIFHPKMYLMVEDANADVIVGSSNLTVSGLSKNAEANILLRDAKSSRAARDAFESYVRLKFDNRFVPDEDFLTLYEQGVKRVSKVESSTQLVSEVSQIQKDLNEKAGTLRKPKATRKDLVGWLELVYEVLPKGEFSTSQLYEHESDFASIYPENRNIKAKIRQQLQDLRDLGFIEHISRNKWRTL